MKTMSTPTPHDGLSSASRREGTSVETKTVTMTRDGRTVELIGVFHVASPEFWAHVGGRIMVRLAGGGEVHTEGVRDRPRKLSDAYKRVVHRMIQRHGFLDQGTALKTHYGRHMLVTDLHIGEIGAIWGQRRVRALRLLTKLPTTFLAVMPTEVAHSVLGSVAASRMSGDAEGAGLIVRQLILDMNDAREARAVTAIERSTSDVTAIWGAAHIPNLVGHLTELGWTVTGETWHPIFVMSPESQQLEEALAERRRARAQQEAALRVHE